MFDFQEPYPFQVILVLYICQLQKGNVNYENHIDFLSGKILEINSSLTFLCLTALFHSSLKILVQLAYGLEDMYFGLKNLNWFHEFGQLPFLWKKQNNFMKSNTFQALYLQMNFRTIDAETFFITVKYSIHRTVL